MVADGGEDRVARAMGHAPSVAPGEPAIGPCVVVTNAKYPANRHTKRDLRGPIVRRGAKVGANATLLPGVVIGENALVGAGSVVTRDVPANAVVVGNPARVIKDLHDLPPYADGGEEA